MPHLYDRRIVADVAGLRITDPRMAVDIERSVDPSQDNDRSASTTFRTRTPDRS